MTITTLVVMVTTDVFHHMVVKSIGSEHHMFGSDVHHSVFTVNNWSHCCSEIMVLWTRAFFNALKVLSSGRERIKSCTSISLV